MPSKVEQVLIGFLRRQAAQGKKLGVALSGGPDSMALACALRRTQRLLSTQITLLHYDHAWRQESAQEARKLALTAEQWGLPLISERASVPAPSRDIENNGRQARRAFFAKSAAEHNLDAILLAQHADDQAETVLKRLLEGASLGALAGMHAVSEENALVLWRPFLDLRRKELLDYLEAQKISYFCDPTNSDLRFLRGRLREQILPRLSQDFGKEPTSALCSIGRQASEFSDYLDRKVRALLNEFSLENGSCKVPLDRLPSEMLEAQHFLRRLCGGLPRDILQQVLEPKGQWPRRWQTGSLQVERSRRELVFRVIRLK